MSKSKDPHDAKEDAQQALRKGTTKRKTMMDLLRDRIWGDTQMSGLRTMFQCHAERDILQGTSLVNGEFRA